ncbi:MAG: 50S ribosomal protein L17 [Acidobacteria bacterium CG_4_9_14_3_um_filter_49_7]|nr:MAG: 50S ribosomal protein L17 [Acidobacteria bacterium CG_4_9_14_3_um_filter_49_7]
MRHRKKYSKLGLTTNQRKALLKGLTISLLEHGAIVTTKARAKQLRAYAERIISKVKKEDEAHARRLVFRKLQSKLAVKKLFDEYKEVFADRPGGYTRIHLLGNRAGDAAEMARISLILGSSAKVEEEAEKKQTAEAKAEKPVKKAKTAKKAESKPVKVEASEEVEAEAKPAEDKPKDEKPATEAKAVESKAKPEKPAKKKVTKTETKPAENDQKAE